MNTNSKPTMQDFYEARVSFEVEKVRLEHKSFSRVITKEEYQHHLQSLEIEQEEAEIRILSSIGNPEALEILIRLSWNREKRLMEEREKQMTSEA